MLLLYYIYFVNAGYLKSSLQKPLEGFMGCETHITNRLNLSFQSVNTDFLHKSNSKLIYISLKVRNKIVSDIKVSVEEIYMETPE